MKHLFFLIILCLAISHSLATELVEYDPTDEITIEKRLALTILQNNCNICHKSENPSKFFTLDNMDGFAKKINRQVFVWKRMPKGNDNNLTVEQREILKNWINQSL